MRVLVTSVPTPGHVNPLVPLALRLQADGDDVLWAAGPDACQRLSELGVRTETAGPPMSVWFERLRARTRGQPGDGIPLDRRSHWFVPRLFGEVGAPLMVDDLLAVARRFAPDVVLYESRCYAAPLAARLVGAQPVLRAVTMLMPPEIEHLANDAVTPLWRELGLDPPYLAGAFDGLVMSEWPASLDDPSEYGELVVHRLAPASQDDASPKWLTTWVQAQHGRQIVYATLGTQSTGTGAFRLLLDAVADEDVAVLMTVGSTIDVDALGTLPANVRVERYVPQEQLLPHCAAAITHGGSGTTLGALAKPCRRSSFRRAPTSSSTRPSWNGPLSDEVSPLLSMRQRCAKHCGRSSTTRPSPSTRNG